MKINIIKIFLLTTVLGVMHVYMYGISVCAADVLSKTINISDNICWQYSPEDNTVYIDGEGDLLLGDVSKFIKKQNVVNVVINSGITSIGYGAFSGCQTIRTIEIPETVKTIDSKAFSNCFSLKEITFPENISVISKDSFMNCHGLQKITNNSKVDLSFSFIGLKTKWMVDNTKTDKLSSGETANVIPKYIKIKYDTKGGRIKGKKTAKAMYGDVQRIKLPTAEKKGYIFAGWYAKGGTKLGNRIWNSDMKFGCFSSIYCPLKNIKLVATYKKIKVKKYSSDKIRITMKANRLYKKHKVAIEIADNNEMKNAYTIIGIIFSIVVQTIALQVVQRPFFLPTYDRHSVFKSYWQPDVSRVIRVFWTPDVGHKYICRCLSCRQIFQDF